MTIEDIKKSDKLFLSAVEISEVLECDPHDIRLQAHERPEKLGFPVVVIGSRVRIPRKPFLKYLSEGE